MTKSMALVAAAACGAVILIGWWVQSAPAPAKDKVPAVVKWEYKVITPRTWKPDELEKELDNLGAEGWELVNFTGSTETGRGVVPAFCAVLKRPKK